MRHSTAYRELSGKMFAKETQELLRLWQAFKNARACNEHLQVYDERYMTVLDRETLIDILFERLMNEKECHRTGDVTAHQ